MKQIFVLLILSLCFSISLASAEEVNVNSATTLDVAQTKDCPVAVIEVRTANKGNFDSTNKQENNND